MKEKFGLQAIRQILSTFDLDISLQGHVGELKPLLFSTHSPVENKNDLELDFKVFFFTDSCCSDIVHDESK